MGVTPSRKVLCQPPKSQEGGGDTKRDIFAFFKNHRLVRNELCQEVQCSVHDQQEHVCDSISLIQESSKSIQQKDVRPILPMQADQIQGVGHDCGPTELFRVGSFRRDYPIFRD